MIKNNILIPWIAPSFSHKEKELEKNLTGELVLGIIAYIGGLLTLGTFSKKELQFMKNCVFR